MFLYLIVVLTLVKTCTLSTSPGEDEYQTKIETLEVKQELVSTASKLLHEDMLLIQRAMKNYHQLNLEQFKNFSNGFLSSSRLHNNFTKAGMDSLHSLLTNIAQQQEFHKTQIQTLSNTFINNMTMMASKLSEIETELTEVLSNQRKLDSKVEKVCNATMVHQNASKECSEGWKRYQNHCFLFSTEAMRWNEAKHTTTKLLYFDFELGKDLLKKRVYWKRWHFHYNLDTDYWQHIDSLVTITVKTVGTRRYSDYNQMKTAEGALRVRLRRQRGL